MNTLPATNGRMGMRVIERITAIVNPIAINECGITHKNPNKATMDVRNAEAFKHPNKNVDIRWDNCGLMIEL